MMMMKNPILLMTCVLLFSSLVASQYNPEKCCFKFYSRPLPKNKVVNFEYTDNLCPMEAVLFKMLKGHQICADPSMEWAKIIIEELQAKKANSSVLEGSA